MAPGAIAACSGRGAIAGCCRVSLWCAVVRGRRGAINGCRCRVPLCAMVRVITNFGGCGGASIVC